MDYPKPTWRPDVDIDIDVIASKITFFTNNQKPFVVYANGTCVFPSVIDEGVDEHCYEFLEAVVFQFPNFEVSEMDDGNYLVSFTGPVYSLVLNEEFDKQKVYIVKSINEGGLLPGEKILSGDDEKKPAEHYYIGLFARARLYADVADNEVLRHINM